MAEFQAGLTFNGNLTMRGNRIVSTDWNWSGQASYGVGDLVVDDTGVIYQCISAVPGPAFGGADNASPASDPDSWQGITASIDNLGDVDTTTTAPANDQVLAWDGTNWIPSAGYSQTDFNAHLNARIEAATDETVSNTTAVASKRYVAQEVAGIVDEAPEVLNTLNELATALGNDANFAATTTRTFSDTFRVTGSTATSTTLTLAGTGGTQALTFTPTDPNRASFTIDNVTLTADTDGDVSANVPSANRVNNDTLVFKNGALLVLTTDYTVASNIGTDSDQDGVVLLGTVAADDVVTFINGGHNTGVDTADTAAEANVPVTSSGYNIQVLGRSINSDGSAGGAFVPFTFNMDAMRNRALLQGGFLLTEGNPVGTRTPYTGSVIGEPPTTYWYDSDDDSWYDGSDADANRLIGF